MSGIRKVDILGIYWWILPPLLVMDGKDSNEEEFMQIESSLNGQSTFYDIGIII